MRLSRRSSGRSVRALRRNRGTDRSELLIENRLAMVDRVKARIKDRGVQAAEFASNTQRQRAILAQLMQHPRRHSYGRRQSFDIIAAASSATTNATDPRLRIPVASRRCRARPSGPSNRLNPAAMTLVFSIEPLPSYCCQHPDGQGQVRAFHQRSAGRQPEGLMAAGNEAQSSQLRRSPCRKTVLKHWNGACEARIGPTTARPAARGRSTAASGQMQFARGDDGPDRFRYRDWTMGLLAGVDPHDLAGHERVYAVF